MADELIAFHQIFHDCYGRVEHHRLGMAYLSGLMSNLSAKSAEPIALELLGEKGVRPLHNTVSSFIFQMPYGSGARLPKSALTKMGSIEWTLMPTASTIGETTLFPQPPLSFFLPWNMGHHRWKRDRRLRNIGEQERKGENCSDKERNRR